MLFAAKPKIRNDTYETLCKVILNPNGELVFKSHCVISFRSNLTVHMVNLNVLGMKTDNLKHYEKFFRILVWIKNLVCKAGLLVKEHLQFTLFICVFIFLIFYFFFSAKISLEMFIKIMRIFICSNI